MNGPKTVKFRGQELPVIGERRVGGRRYLLLKRLNANDSQAYQVFDPFAGPGGDLAVLHLLPRSAASEQRIKVLGRLGRQCHHFPGMVSYERRHDEVAIVLAWIEGENLREFLAGIRQGRNRRPSAVEASRLIGRLAHGLSLLHGKKASVHGDIKPANLLLTRSLQRLVLVDFGSAWPVERTLKRDAGDGVSAPYAAPEQMAGGGFVDWRADVFALSVVWYELLTLAIPYDGVGGRAGLPQLRAKFGGKLVPPSELSPDRDRIPAIAWRKIDDTVCRGLALAADERFADSRQWRNALDGIQRELDQPTTLEPRYRLLLRWLERLLPRPKQ